MSESPTKLLEGRIATVVERVRMLAAERDALLREIDTLRSRLGEIEQAASSARSSENERLERENGRLREALELAVRQLREESGP
ncbi:MAG TPA: hypothetical protein VMR65_01245 [Candidatus Sulfotelmatobacter sp.]|jgi:hypothetical protein|nr:hypothetical protein [Candidatus Sulfotelmatobacter sp.]